MLKSGDLLNQPGPSQELTSVGKGLKSESTGRLGIKAHDRSHHNPDVSMIQEAGISKNQHARKMLGPVTVQ